MFKKLLLTSFLWSSVQGQFIEGDQVIEGKDVYTLTFGFLMSGPNEYYVTWNKHVPGDNITSFDNTVKDANTYILMKSIEKISLCDMFKELSTYPTMLYSCDVIDTKTLEIVARRRVSLSIISIISKFLEMDNNIDLSQCSTIAPYIGMNTRINFSVVGSKTTLWCIPNKKLVDKIIWKLPNGTTVDGSMLVIDDLQFNHMDLYTCQLFSSDILKDQQQSFVYPLAKDLNDSDDSDEEEEPL